METPNLKELRELRIQEKAIKARIESIMPAAKDEALRLAPDGGIFSTPDGATFVLDRVPVYDLTNFNRYKDDLAKCWRLCAKQREKIRIEATALTAQMAGYLKSFIQSTNLPPEYYDYTIKVKS